MVDNQKEAASPRAFAEKILIPVAVGVVLAALGVAWNWGTGVGVVRLLGGMTQSDIEAKLQALKVEIVESSPASASLLPDKAVIAVATAECPQPWQSFEPASGSFILGAGKGFAFKDEGGRASLTLLAENLPQHQHETMLSTIISREAAFGSGTARNPALQGGAVSTDWPTTMTSMFPPSPAAPIDTMPPYYVLQYCQL